MLIQDRVLRNTSAGIGLSSNPCLLEVDDKLTEYRVSLAAIIECERELSEEELESIAWGIATDKPLPDDVTIVSEMEYNE